MTKFISSTQDAFVSNRSILHNILLCQDIVKMYVPRQKKCCMMKINLQKAYDTVCWEFVEDLVLAFRFPRRFVNLIMVCVKSHLYSAA